MLFGGEAYRYIMINPDLYHIARADSTLFLPCKRRKIMPECVSAAEAVKWFHNRVYSHSVAAALQALINAMVARASEFRGWKPGTFMFFLWLEFKQVLIFHLYDGIDRNEFSAFQHYIFFRYTPNSRLYLFTFTLFCLKSNIGMVMLRITQD